MLDKTKRAIERVENGEKPFAVARDIGMSASGLYVALARKRKLDAAVKCPCCGSMVEPGQIKVPMTDDYTIAGMSVR